MEKWHGYFLIQGDSVRFSLWLHLLSVLSIPNAFEKNEYSEFSLFLSLSKQSYLFSVYLHLEFQRFQATALMQSDLSISPS